MLRDWLSHLAGLLQGIPWRAPGAKMERGERAIKVFVSSVMSPEIEVARRQTVTTLQALPWVQAWAFEFTPGSSENVVNGYLRHVVEADFVIWLVGQTTTHPVQTEIREALRTGRRLLVVKLPRVVHDETTKALLSEVGLRAKWVDPSSAGSFKKALELTLVDEVIRGLRNEPGWVQRTTLEQIKLEIRMRCIARWEASGLTYEQAAEFFGDSSLGDPTFLLSRGIRDVVVLKGEFGIGKSLVADRVLQYLVERFEADPTAPVPIFMKAQVAADNLIEQILSRPRDLGDPRSRGCTVIVDGVDEVGIGTAGRLLSEARVLAHSWPNTSFVLTSRYIPEFGTNNESVSVPRMTKDQAYRLIGRVAGREVTPGITHSWPQSVRSAIELPLFSIILGSQLKERWDNVHIHPESLGDLLRNLVTRALQRSTTADRSFGQALNKLGALSIDRGGGVVPLSELIVDANSLLGTGLVIQEGTGIQFPLPVLAQWFAAQTLIDGSVPIDDLVQDSCRLERWRYSLIIAIGTFPHDKISPAISAVAKTHPGVVSQIIDEGLAKWGLSEDFQAPPQMECGRRVADSMSALVEGIGPLAPLIAPVRKDGSLKPVGVSSNGASLVISWYEGEEDFPAVTMLPKDALFADGGSPGWLSYTFARPGHHSAWAWRWTLGDLTRRLTKIVDEHAFPVPQGFLCREKVWRMALELLDRGTFDHRPIALDTLESFLHSVPPHIDQIIIGWRRRSYSLNLLRGEIARMREQGESMLTPPWPGPDLDFTSGLVWNAFSDDQILSRSRVVFAGAFEGYCTLVQTWFPRFRSRLNLAALLPAKLVAVVQPPRRNEGFQGGPTIHYFFEPLPEGSKSHLDIKFGETERGSSFLRGLHERTRAARPNVAEWISVSYVNSVLDIFGVNSATDLAYHWLKSDLKKIRWLS